MKLAIFDLDGTLISKEMLPHMLKYWKNNNYPRLPFYKCFTGIIYKLIQYKMKAIDKESFRAGAMNVFTRMFKDLSEDELDQYFTNVFNELINYTYLPAADELKELKSNEFETVILSGNYKPLVKKIADHYDFQHVIATELSFKDGYVDYSKKLDVVMGKNKLIKLNAYFYEMDIDWHNSTSYADSYYDIPILELTGNPVAVNPDEQLTDYANNNNWRII